MVMGCCFFLPFFFASLVAICLIAHGVFPESLAKATLSSVGVSAGCCLAVEVYLGSSNVLSHVVFVSACTFIIAPFVGAAKHWWRTTRHRRGHCRKCGYNLTGNVSGRCPECGTEVEVERPGT